MKWFDIPNELIPKLRELQAKDSEDSIVKSEDAVVMFYGLGDPLYLAFDGRVIIQDMFDDIPPREAKDLKEAAVAVVVGAKVRKFPELLSLLPERPENAVDCENCDKTGWFQPAPTFGPFVCGNCGGLGWTK